MEFVTWAVTSQQLGFLLPRSWSARLLAWENPLRRLRRRKPGTAAGRWIDVVPRPVHRTAIAALAIVIPVKKVAVAFATEP